MYFANFQYIHERIRKYVARAHAYSEAAGLPLQYLLLDMSPVTHVDSTGENKLLFLNVCVHEHALVLPQPCYGGSRWQLLRRLLLPL